MSDENRLAKNFEKFGRVAKMRVAKKKLALEKPMGGGQPFVSLYPVLGGASWVLWGRCVWCLIFIGLTISKPKLSITFHLMAVLIVYARVYKFRIRRQARR